ncbi:MAG: alpha/beta fold hydrolase [Actinomycetota bacterium]|nr:alpha/beta fold hydrolase [Actinomycetota bacterium]
MPRGRAQRRVAVGIALAVALGLVVVGLGRSGSAGDGAQPAVRVEQLQVPVGAEPDGTEVVLEADLYLPDAPAEGGIEAAPAVVLAHGFGGSKDDLRADGERLAGDGYVVLAYTARGFGGSGGRIHLNDPDYEVADASAIIDLLSTRVEVRLDADDDPRVAVVGPSYGGALALMTAGADERVDSVVAMITWNDLADAFYPQHAETGVLRPGDPLEAVDSPGPFKQLWASSFFAAGAGLGGISEGEAAGVGGPLCGRFDPEVCELFLTAAEDGTADAELIELLREHSPAPTLDSVRAPTYLVQGMADSLFGLEHADATARALRQAGVPVAVRWFNGGHDGDGSTTVTAGAGGQGQDAGAVGDDADTEGRPGGGAGPDAGGGGSGAESGSGAEDLGGSAAAAAERERQAQSEAVDDWLVGTLMDPADPADPAGLPLPGLTYALPRERGEDSDRLLTLASYADLRGEGGSAGTRAVRGEELSLEPAGPGGLLNPPGGAPAAITAVPGLGAALTGVPTYALAALPGQHVAFDTEPLTSALVVGGNPRLSLEVSSTGEVSTLFVSLWQVQGGAPTLPRRLVAPVQVEVAPGQPQQIDLALPAGVWDLPAGSTWRVLVTATDTTYRNQTDARLDRIELTDPVLRLPVIEGTPVAGPGPWDGETLGVGGATLAALVLLGGFALRRRSRAESPRSDLADVPLVVEGLVKAFPDGHRAVDDVSWRAERGQVVGLLGPNGAGKTTTLRMVMGLIHPDEGSVHVLGERVGPGAPVLRRVGALVEGPGFLPHLSGRDNLRAYWAATGRSMAEAHLDEALDVAALGAAADRQVRAYSHGMRQRLGIAQAMLGLPEVLILDEPTNGLDPPQIAAMRPILARYAAAGRTVVVSSHLLAEVEMTCSHVVVMHAGRVVAAGSVADVGVADGRNLEEVFLSTIAGLSGSGPGVVEDEGGRTERLRQVRPR